MKCILVGLDGVNPDFVLRMVGQGRLPNFRRLLQEGTFAPHCLSSLPTSTPENWTTIATGAWNGTHQVMSFQVFRPPELRGRWMAGYTSRESQAEFIWDAVERAGKQSILIKYPASHPPTMKTGVQVCGCHVRPCAHQIDGAHVLSTLEPRHTPLLLRAATGLEHLTKPGLPALTGELAFEARGIGGESVQTGLDARSALYGVPDEDSSTPPSVGLDNPVCKLAPPGKTYNVFVFSQSGNGYDTLLISKDPEGEKTMAQLLEGEWSEWCLDRFQTIDGPRYGALRFKLLELSRDAKCVKVYATQVMDIDHYTTPESVGRELYEQVGPFITDIGWEGLGHDVKSALFHERVLAELADYQHGWLAGAVRHLTRSRDWSLCMLQAHCVDCANHHCLRWADPSVNPDEVTVQRYLGFIEGLYESLDRMLGQIIADADDETALFVVSDHGGMTGHIRIDTQAVLEKAGLLVTRAGEIDWSRTTAYVQNGIFVNLNLEGREEQGTVPPAEFDKVCDQVAAALHAYIEPTTGLHPYNLVVRKADARYLGLYGDPAARKVGDVLFTLREPFGGTHGEQLSTARWGLGSNRSLLVTWGPGIRRGVRLERTAWLTDICPTICHLLRVPVPRHTEGAILYQALDDPTVDAA